MMNCNRILRWLGAASLVTAMTALGVGCGQGEGARCQVDNDCSGSLVCNKATQSCASDKNGSDLDAAVQDGPPPDAPDDAAPDAM